MCATAVATAVATAHEEEDKNMNLINTSAPIPIQELKKFFEDKTTYYVIDYATSTLKGSKLLTYLGNLDLPCDINADTGSAEFAELLSSYFHHPLITNIPLLEQETIKVLLERKGLVDFGYSEFIKQNSEIIDRWSNILDSLSLYNLYTVNAPELKEYVESFPKNDTSTTEGINFVSILKHQEFYEFYNVVDQPGLQYYSTYFSQNMFKGSTLYAYWANENNPMFLITFGIASGTMNVEEFVQSKQHAIGEFENVTPV